MSPQNKNLFFDAKAYQKNRFKLNKKWRRKK
jgi:hypothetical protein